MARFTGHETIPAILEAAAAWRDRCLIGDGSMLGGGDVWTPENAASFNEHFVENLLADDRTFIDKFRLQIGQLSPGVIRMAAEAVWLVYLFPRNFPQPPFKRQRIGELWSWSGEELPSSSYLSDEVLDGIANTGQVATSQLYSQLMLIGRVAHACKQMSADKRRELARDGDAFAFAEWLDKITGKARPSMRHALPYLCFPDSFERIIATSAKQHIAKAFQDLVPPELKGNALDVVATDRQLLAIRRRLEQEAGTDKIDFYREPIRSRWLPEPEAGEDQTPGKVDVSKTMHIRRIVAKNPDISLPDLTSELEAGGLDINKATIATIRADVRATIDAARIVGRWRDDPGKSSGVLVEVDPPAPGTEDGVGDPGTHHLADAFIGAAFAERILATLAARKNVILQGAPGVGKTFAARRLALALGAPDDAIDEVQFHQAYGYEDFMEGFRPTAQGGFALKDGQFLALCTRAAQRPGVPHVLVVDEVNRGNVSRILGEAMVLIEADRRGERFGLTLAQSGRRFSVPPNVHLLGLMNTADRSLAMVDYAIRRRFAFFSLEPAFEAFKFGDALLKAGVSQVMLDHIRARFGKLNERIAADMATLGPGYRIGHSFFSNPRIGEGENVWFRSIVETEIAPLLREYWADTPLEAEGEMQALLDGV